MLKLLRLPSPTLAFAAALAFIAAAQAQTETLLNVSYDVSSKLYKDVTPAFIAQWKAGSGKAPVISQSHGGSTAQAQAVANGLEEALPGGQDPTVDSLLGGWGTVNKLHFGDGGVYDQLVVKC